MHGGSVLEGCDSTLVTRLQTANAKDEPAMKPRHNFGPPLGFSKKGVDFSGLPIAFLSIANEPEIYLKAGRFSDHSWSQGDDGIPEKNFLEAHHTHEVIERKIVGLSSPLSSPEPFLPHVDATRFVLTRPSKVRRSSVSSGTGRRHQLNGEPVQGHQVSSTTTTTTRKSTTTIEEHSTSNTVHLLRLSSASLSGSTSACPAEDVPDQGVIRTHADRTSSEAEADEVADAPPPTTARRRSSVAVPEGSVGSGYHRRLSRASGAGDTAGTEAEADDKLGPSSAPRGAQRRLSLAEARRKSIAERGDLLAVPTPQQLRKLSFAESVRDGRDTPDISEATSEAHYDYAGEISAETWDEHFDLKREVSVNPGYCIAPSGLPFLRERAKITCYPFYLATVITESVHCAVSATVL
ncbi:serine-rich adhesin for platelets-like [Ixodes scapularis]